MKKLMAITIIVLASIAASGQSSGSGRIELNSAEAYVDAAKRLDSLEKAIDDLTAEADELSRALLENPPIHIGAFGDSVFIELYLNDTVNVRIFNLVGQKVCECTITGIGITAIDTRTWMEGIYVASAELRYYYQKHTYHYSTKLVVNGKVNTYN